MFKVPTRISFFRNMPQVGSKSGTIQTQKRNLQCMLFVVFFLTREARQANECFDKISITLDI